MFAETGNIDFAICDYRGHAGCAIGTGYSDAIHVSLTYTRKRADHLGDFGSGDIFAFPSKGISNSIYEIKEPMNVPFHQIAGAEPRVIRLEHVSNDLLVRFLLVTVPVKTRGMI